MLYEWMKYDPYLDGFPPKEQNLKLPNSLFFIVQNTSVLLFDWMAYNQNIMIVSEKFLTLLKDYVHEDCFETSVLTTVSKNEKKLNISSQYYAIRVDKYDDSLFDISEQGKKRAIGLRDTFLYPNISLKESIQKEIFFLSKFCYLQSIILTQSIKEIIVKKCYVPEIYKIEDFPYVYNNKFDLDKLPNVV